VAIFASDFTNEFKLESPYSDVTNSPSELPRESLTEVFVGDSLGKS